MSYRSDPNCSFAADREFTVHTSHGDSYLLSVHTNTSVGINFWMFGLLVNQQKFFIENRKSLGHLLLPSSSIDSDPSNVLRLFFLTEKSHIVCSIYLYTLHDSYVIDPFALMALSRPYERHACGRTSAPQLQSVHHWLRQSSTVSVIIASTFAFEPLGLKVPFSLRNQLDKSQLQSIRCSCTLLCLHISESHVHASIKNTHFNYACLLNRLRQLSYHSKSARKKTRRFLSFAVYL